MASLIRHRGPDDEGYALFDLSSDHEMIFAGHDTPCNVKESSLNYAASDPFIVPDKRFSVGFAHRRLSIVDLSASGHQPMCDETGRFWIAINGEIYNYLEIRQELEKRGYRFRSSTDTEVFLKAYIEWGDHCQERFNGMWAVLIWDNLRKTIWISRDRFGVKPLYYMIHHEFFVVCSEIKCIMPLLPLKPFMQEIYCYLADGSSEVRPETFFENIFRFPSGHSAVVGAGNPIKKIDFSKYFELGSPNLGNDFSKTKLKNYAEEYYHLLKDAVKLRLRADVAVSCALSGGLDSSSITYLACETLKEQNNVFPLTTVSNIFKSPGTNYCDESKFINLVEQGFPIRAFKKEPKPDNLLHKNDLGLWYAENGYEGLPISPFNTFELCRQNNIKVNLDGQGADEILAGYGRTWAWYFRTHPVYRFDYLVSLITAPPPLAFKLKNALRFNSRYRDNSFLFSKLKDKIEESYRAKRFVANSRPASNEQVNNALYANVLFSVKKLLRNVDFLSMAYSIESRQPFMDYRLISFLNRIPYTYKLHAGWTKYIARFAFQDMLHPEIVWRKKKMGWPTPMSEWLSGGAKQKILEKIRQSPFIAEIVGQLKTDDMKTIQENVNCYLRLYNIARQYDLFYEKPPSFQTVKLSQK